MASKQAKKEFCNLLGVGCLGMEGGKGQCVYACISCGSTAVPFKNFFLRASHLPASMGMYCQTEKILTRSICLTIHTGVVSKIQECKINGALAVAQWPSLFGLVFIVIFLCCQHSQSLQQMATVESYVAVRSICQCQMFSHMQLQLINSSSYDIELCYQTEQAPLD